MFHSLEQHTMHNYQMSDKIMNWWWGELDKAESWNSQVAIRSRRHFNNFLTPPWCLWATAVEKKQLIIVWWVSECCRVGSSWVSLLGEVVRKFEDRSVAAGRLYWVNVKRKTGHHHSMITVRALSMRASSLKLERLSKVAVVKVGNSLWLYRWRSCLYRGNVGPWIGGRMI